MFRLWFRDELAQITVNYDSNELIKTDNSSTTNYKVGEGRGQTHVQMMLMSIHITTECPVCSHVVDSQHKTFTDIHAEVIRKCSRCDVKGC